jgi:hypothetical protein
MALAHLTKFGAIASAPSSITHTLKNRLDGSPAIQIKRLLVPQNILSRISHRFSEKRAILIKGNCSHDCETAPDEAGNLWKNTPDFSPFTPGIWASIIMRVPAGIDRQVG